MVFCIDSLSCTRYRNYGGPAYSHIVIAISPRPELAARLVGKPGGILVNVRRKPGPSYRERARSLTIYRLSARDRSLEAAASLLLVNFPD